MFRSKYFKKKKQGYIYRTYSVLGKESWHGGCSVHYRLGCITTFPKPLPFNLSFVSRGGTVIKKESLDTLEQLLRDAHTLNNWLLNNW